MRYRDKLDWVREHARGGRVLYLGDTDGDAENIRKHDALFEAVRGLAENVTAVYRAPAEAERLIAAGHRAVATDPERMELGAAYDLILAFDNIEHMSNAGAFLDGVARHLAPGGVFLVTTPNPLGLVRIGELLFVRRGKANREHTCWYTGQVLNQLAARHGLRVTEEVSIDDMYAYHRPKPGAVGLSPARVARAALMALNFVVCSVMPRLSETNGFALERRDAGREASS